MGNHKLSEGALATIMTGGTVDEPIMQVLGSKKILGNADKERYRLLVSDGKYQISFAMIATQINERITSGELSNNSVIKVKKYITSMINNGGKGDRRVMVILDMEILTRGEEVGQRIGNPSQLPDDPSSTAKNEPKTSGTSNGTASTSAPKPVAPKPKPAQVVAPVFDSGSTSNKLTVPIRNLSPYQNKWVVKARVTNKSGVRTWSNSKGEGKLFSFDLADESGEIRATAFRDLVDKFFDLIEIDKVYYISKCQIKIANRKFTNIDNDYEMAMNSETTITPCFDEMSVPKPVNNFVPFDQISAQEVGGVIDVIGICKAVGDLQVIVARATKKELRKRELTLVDQTKNSVQLTLWGDDAENYKEDEQSVVSVRGARVGEFGGGKNLTMTFSSVMKHNPDYPEAHRLRGWYDNEGKTVEVVNISAKIVSGGFHSDWMNINDVKEGKLGGGDNADYYQCKATVLMINSNNVTYKACPADDCNKKIIDFSNQQYRCEKCNKEYDRFKYRMIMSANISDWSDNQWVSMFAGEAEKLIGMTSQELGEAIDADKDCVTTHCSKPCFTDFVFRCRAKLETYNDEQRLKSVVMRIEPVNYKKYNTFLANSIKEACHL